jgi:hypothetical protein
MPSSNGSLIIAIMLKAKCTVHAVVMLYYIPHARTHTHIYMHRQEAPKENLHVFQRCYNTAFEGHR